MSISESEPNYWRYVNSDSGSEAILYPSSLGDGAVIEIRPHDPEAAANPALLVRPQDVAEFSGKLREYAIRSADGELDRYLRDHHGQGQGPACNFPGT